MISLCSTCGADAADACVDCGRPACVVCALALGDETFCPPCRAAFGLDELTRFSAEEWETIRTYVRRPSVRQDA